MSEFLEQLLAPTPPPCPRCSKPAPGARCPNCNADTTRTFIKNSGGTRK